MEQPKISTTPIAERGSSYQRWVESEGIPLIGGFFIEDIQKVELAAWKSKGGLGARICLDGTGETNDAYICEIPAGKSLKPQKHFFEELVYIISGKGATTIWNQGGPKRTFEWQEGSLFSPPLNSWYQHFNGMGNEPARYIAVTSAPCMINLIHSLDFIFNCDYVFKDRFNSEEDYFSKAGTWYSGRTWQTNFVSDVRNLQLLEWKERGGGASQVRFELSENTLCGHVSQFGVGAYKKAHFHGPGAHVIILSGQGYSLLWPPGQAIQRYDWKPGSLVVPPANWFHQHFNAGSEPARYLALRWGSQKYHEMWGEGKGKTDIDVKLGGNQIEYEDEDPLVRRMFEEACAKAGVKSTMDRYCKKSQ
jgi:oxalate decarboxylase/phosphoglucose isomerase-like protein (cupin superfamily)/mannose-6-phosphate isomerase-like protein (cupin superfamily)